MIVHIEFERQIIYTVQSTVQYRSDVFKLTFWWQWNSASRHLSGPTSISATVNGVFETPSCISDWSMSTPKRPPCKNPRELNVGRSLGLIYWRKNITKNTLHMAVVISPLSEMKPLSKLLCVPFCMPLQYEDPRHGRHVPEFAAQAMECGPKGLDHPWWLVVPKWLQELRDRWTPWIENLWIRLWSCTYS